MKIRELDPNKAQYIIVHDLGKSEYSYGMRVIGKVIELRYNFDKEIVSADSKEGAEKITKNVKEVGL